MAEPSQRELWERARRSAQRLLRNSLNANGQAHYGSDRIGTGDQMPMLNAANANQIGDGADQIGTAANANAASANAANANAANANAANANAANANAANAINSTSSPSAAINSAAIPPMINPTNSNDSAATNRFGSVGAYGCGNRGGYGGLGGLGLGALTGRIGGGGRFGSLSATGYSPNRRGGSSKRTVMRARTPRRAQEKRASHINVTCIIIPEVNIKTVDKKCVLGLIAKGYGVSTIVMSNHPWLQGLSTILGNIARQILTGDEASKFSLDHLEVLRRSGGNGSIQTVFPCFDLAERSMFNDETWGSQSLTAFYTGDRGKNIHNYIFKYKFIPSIQPSKMLSAQYLVSDLKLWHGSEPPPDVSEAFLREVTAASGDAEAEDTLHPLDPAIIPPDIEDDAEEGDMGTQLRFRRGVGSAERQRVLQSVCGDTSSINVSSNNSTTTTSNCLSDDTLSPSAISLLNSLPFIDGAEFRTVQSFCHHLARWSESGDCPWRLVNPKCHICKVKFEHAGGSLTAGPCFSCCGATVCWPCMDSYRAFQRQSGGDDEEPSCPYHCREQNPYQIIMTMKTSKMRHSPLYLRYLREMTLPLGDIRVVRSVRPSRADANTGAGSNVVGNDYDEDALARARAESLRQFHLDISGRAQNPINLNSSSFPPDPFFIALDSANNPNAHNNNGNSNGNNSADTNVDLGTGHGLGASNAGANNQADRADPAVLSGGGAADNGNDGGANGDANIGSGASGGSPSDNGGADDVV